MLSKIIPALALGLWAVSGFSDDVPGESVNAVADCQPCQTPAPAAAPAPSPEPASATPCTSPAPKPAPAPCPVQAPKPDCAKPAPRKPCPPKPCPSKPSCNPQPPCCWNFNPCNPKGCTAMNCAGFFIDADFLYWRAENHGFSYAYQLETNGQNIGRIVRVNPEWEPAFRVGIGVNTSYDFWDVFLNYTWYRNNSSQTSKNSTGYIPLWPKNETAEEGQFQTVYAKNRFVLDMGDLEIGRLVYLTKSIAIRPHWGARGGRIYEKFISDFSSPTADNTLVTEQKFNGKNNYWGVGPRAGMSGELHLSQRFSFLGKAAAALLYGKNQVSETNSERLQNAARFTIERQYRDDFWQLVPNLQLLLGLQWQTCFWCEKMFFKMSAAWETNFWWDQFNLPFAATTSYAPFPTVGNQPLTMEGLTVNFEWDF